ncbi:MAG: cytochrome c [Chlorobiaceae bacterium]|nr:cytochrome c [Chlorobiaceae bacterium]
MNNAEKIILTGLVIGLSGSVTGTFPQTASAAVDGKAVFDKNCSVCHSISPPPKLAPPIVPISARYHQKISSRTEGISRMAAFIKSPSKEKVLADPQAIVRFGMMPPVTLNEAELNAVAAWVWDQNTSGTMRPGSGAGQGAGKGECIQK